MLHLPLCYSVLFFCQRPGIIEKRKAVTLLRADMMRGRTFLNKLCKLGRLASCSGGHSFLLVPLTDKYRHCTAALARTVSIS